MSFICAVVASNNGNQIVIVAALMTLAIVLSLTLYAIFTRTDFTTMWAILVVFIMALIMLGIFTWIAWTPFLENLYCCLGVFVFGLYLVIDTQLIIGGKGL